MICDEHPAGCPIAEAGRAFYVSVRSGSRTGILAGPYATHVEALAAGKATRALAEKADRFSAFYAFGTLQASDNLRPVFGRVEA